MQPTATPDPPVTPEPPVTPVLELGPGGSVPGFGPDADAAQVVAHLSELFGGPPRDESGTEVQGLVTVSGFACSTNRRPGASLSWGDFALIVRTDDDARAPGTRAASDGARAAGTVARVQAPRVGSRLVPWTSC